MNGDIIKTSEVPKSPRFYLKSYVLPMFPMNYVVQ